MTMIKKKKKWGLLRFNLKAWWWWCRICCSPGRIRGPVRHWTILGDTQKWRLLHFTVLLLSVMGLGWTRAGKTASVSPHVKEASLGYSQM